MLEDIIGFDTECRPISVVSRALRSFRMSDTCKEKYSFDPFWQYFMKYVQFHLHDMS